MQHRLVKAIVLMSFISASIGFSPTVHREAKIRIFDPLRNGFGSSSLARKDVNIQSPAPPKQDTAYTSRKISTFLRIKDDKSKPEINIAQQEQVSPATGVITVAGAGIEIDYDILRNYVAKNATTAQPATTVVQLDQPEHTTRSNRQLQALLDLTQTDVHRLYMDSKTTLPKHFGRNGENSPLCRKESQAPPAQSRATRAKTLRGQKGSGAGNLGTGEAQPKSRKHFFGMPKQADCRTRDSIVIDSGATAPYIFATEAVPEKGHPEASKLPSCGRQGLRPAYASVQQTRWGSLRDYASVQEDGLEAVRGVGRMEPVAKAQKGPANKKQEWSKVRNPKEYMASLMKDDDSDDVPDLNESSDDEEEPKARKSTVPSDTKNRTTHRTSSLGDIAQGARHRAASFQEVEAQCTSEWARSSAPLPPHGTENFNKECGKRPTDPKKARMQDGTDTQRQTTWVAGIMASQQVNHHEMDNTCAPTIITSKGITAKRGDDSDGMPELGSPPDNEPVTIESKQFGEARPTTETTSGYPADNKAARASVTKTQKGSPMEDLINAPRRSVRTQIQVEHYKPTSRSVNMAQAEIDAMGKPYASKGQEGATKTRAGREPEGARQSTTSDGKPVEVHYLMYVDDVVVGRAGRQSGTATSPTPA